MKKIYIETTNVCNLNCNFCPKTKRAPKFMSPDEFCYIIQQVKPVTDSIYLHLMGEPTLNPNMEFFLAECEKEQMKVNMTTNGTLLPLHADKLLCSKSLRQINISLHSFEANETTLTLGEYIHNVLEFVKRLQQESNILCSIRLWNMDYQEIKGENERNEEILQMIEEQFEQKEIRELLLKDWQLKISDRVYLNMAQKFEWPDIEIAEIGDEVFCHGLRKQAGILVDGTVVPCCLDSEGTIALGNVFETPFVDILKGERAMNMYNGFSNRRAVEELCRKCGYATRFKK